MISYHPENRVSAAVLPWKRLVSFSDNLFCCRRRTEFFELVSKGGYDWNIKNHREVFR